MFFLVKATVLLNLPFYFYLRSPLDSPKTERSFLLLISPLSFIFSFLYTTNSNFTYFFVVFVYTHTIMRMTFKHLRTSPTHILPCQHYTV